ncbi:oxygenase MpaB family protein [uncultured Abyssibacter sp.]|uniref:oxygenase MpaB family protein n=1 Tax=uncultured Abyssibacter sp. TaxID=2320202 RepID=UPI0032B1A7EF
MTQPSRTNVDHAAPSGKGGSSRRVDFTSPPGEPALIPANSMTWQVFKNPVATYIGGITAVILELAEPRVCAGVWDHTTFRTDPLRRLRRTGLAAMMTVYGARSEAERMIAGVRRMHDRVSGVTASGQAYRASEPELLNWVQATASFGFLEAYAQYVHALDARERDAFYGESAIPARLYGAVGAPTSEAGLQSLFQTMEPRLTPTPVIFEFLELMRRTAVFPRPLRPLQERLLRAAVDIVPAWALDKLEIGPQWRLRAWERPIVRLAGGIADRWMIPGSPAIEACRRLGHNPKSLYPRFPRIAIGSV